MVDRRFSVLVADEDSDSRRAYQDTLRRRGYRVLPAESGRRAVDVIRSRPVHVVVMDFRLPDYSGVEIYHAMKTMSHEFLPCIFTAVKATSAALCDAMAEEAVTILPKPVELMRLVHAVDWSVDRYLGRRSRYGERSAPDAPAAEARS
jgi:DNA-binding NtrC family response regulator